jgi:hypothetical protein
LANFNRKRIEHGNREFNYLPETYELPEQMQEFRETFIDNQRGKRENVWIVKPASSSRGRGIFLLKDLKDVPDDYEHYVVCRYISKPLLVSGYKCDLRIYVLVTSIDPLRIYIYNEGLVRFASEPYQAGKGSIYSHLTNYSLNKTHDAFVENKNAHEQDVGNKWSLSAF